MEDNRLRYKSGRFWQCPNGHTEKFIPFEDVLKPAPGRAARACSLCHIGMQLVTWHWNKLGQLIDQPVVVRRKAEYDEAGNLVVAPIVRRIVSPRAVIRRLLRRLPKYEAIDHYRNSKDGSVSLAISRINEVPLEVNGTIYEKRRIVLVSSTFVPMSVRITMVGVHGWLEDVKKAVKKAKLYIVDIESRECAVLPPPKEVKHRRVYKHRFVNKYLTCKIARVADRVAKVARTDKGRPEQTIEQAFERIALSVAKKFGAKLSSPEVKKVVREARRQLAIDIDVC